MSTNKIVYQKWGKLKFMVSSYCDLGIIFIIIYFFDYYNFLILHSDNVDCEIMETDIKPENVKKINDSVDDGNQENGQSMFTINSNMDNLPGCSYDKLKELDTSHHLSNNKKVHSKHALRQQAKRRRKNTTIASGNTSLPRIIVKPLPPQSIEEISPLHTKIPTMREVLASIPGFSIKPRKRSNKKLSTAAQLEQTKEGCIDLETPDSILVNTNLRALLNKHTFSILPPLYQYKLVQLLPNVDRPGTSSQPDIAMRLSSSGLNNEFFARACLEWRERLSEGEFTPENQQKLKSEAEREKSKLDPWKLKHFEPMWGEKNHTEESIVTDSLPRPTLKTTIKLRPTASVSKPVVPKPIRTVGAVTRAQTSFRGEIDKSSEPSESVSKSSIPDLIPIKSSSKLSIPRPEIVLSQSQSNDSNESNETFTNEVDPLQITDNSMEFTETKTEDGNLSVSSSLSNIEHIFGTAESFDMVDDGQNSNSNEKSDFKKDSSISPVDFSPEELEADKISSAVLCEQDSSTSENKESDAKSENEYKTDTSFGYCESNKDYDNEHFQNNNFSELDEVHSNKSPVTECTLNDNSLDKSDSVCSKQEYFKNLTDITDDQADDNQQINFEETISGLLPNSIILQQEPVLNTSCSSDVEIHIDKLKSTLEHDLDLSQLSEPTNFHQNVNNLDDNDEETNEVRLMVAENYVLESGAIDSLNLNSNYQICEQQQQDEIKLEDKTTDEIQATLLSTGNTQDEECCWNVDSSTEKMLSEVPLHTLDSVAVPMKMVDTDNETGDVSVIPMQEELEVRLEESSFPMSDDWPYDAKMDTDMMASALSNTSDNANMTQATPMPQYQEYSTNQVKLELEVTLTPEVLPTDNFITSSGCTTNNLTSTSTTSIANKPNIATIIPPTTIVCLPTVISSSSMLTAPNNQLTTIPTSNFINNNPNRTAMVASSSAVPYLALSTSQPMRAVATHSKSKLKSSKDILVSSGSTNRNRNSSNKPPGAVNLERSYQICQAVIQNSPNRDQLRCQLKPPPSLLASNKKCDGSRATQYGQVSSSRSANKPFTPPLPAPNNFTMMQGSNGVKHISGGPAKINTIRTGGLQRQQSSPVLVRHVFTSSQGIPVTMAVLPSTQNTVSSEVSIGLIL